MEYKLLFNKEYNINQINYIANLIISTIKPHITIILLEGELGSGKTTLVKAICNILEINKVITSPTFSICNTYYSQKYSISHLDLYRINNLEEFYLSGLQESININNITFIEWPDIIIETFLSLPHYKIKLIILNEFERKIELFAYL